MRIDTALKLRNIAVLKINDLDRRARFYGMSHDAILAEKSQIDMKKAPGWVRTYVEGYMQCLRDKWYTDGTLVWAHVAPDGTRYTADKNVPAWAQPVDPLYQAGKGAEIATWKSGHFWRKSGCIFS
ncbi:MAG TPA: hypothetical protein PLD10_13185 [Rhodopila sp.]|nr:hypothetical protein [Rhodopila sp.]